MTFEADDVNNYPYITYVIRDLQVTFHFAVEWFLLSKKQWLVFFSEIYPNKDKLGSGKTTGDVYPLTQHIIDDSDQSLSDDNKKPSTLHPHTGHSAKLTPDDEFNSESLWSASLSGRGHEVIVHGGQSAVSDVLTGGNVKPQTGRSVHTAADTLASSYKDDFTDVSESILVDKSTDHARSSRSRRLSHPSTLAYEPPSWFVSVLI